MKFQKGHLINLGRIKSEETKSKISSSTKGRVSPMLGKHHDIETRKKISLSNKGRVGVFLGKHHTEETKQKLRLANVGKRMSNEFREKCRQRQLGKKLSEATKIKMRTARLGREVSLETRKKIAETKIGSKNPMFGQKPTMEHRLKISENLRKTLGGRTDRTVQELIHQIRGSVKSKLWRESVFKRDKFTCILCGDNRGGNLEADHIEPFIKLFKLNKIDSIESAEDCVELWCIENGRTVCKDCHKKTPTWGSKSRYIYNN